MRKDLGFILLVSRVEVLINRDYWGAFVCNCQKRNSWIYNRRIIAKIYANDVVIDQERNLGDRRLSDTVLLLAISHVD